MQLLSTTMVAWASRFLRGTLVVAVAVLVSGAFCANTQAALLGIDALQILTPNARTDIHGSGARSGYTASSDVFTITNNLPTSIDFNNTGPVDYNVVNGTSGNNKSFALSILVNDSGQVYGGSATDLVIKGVVDTDNSGNGITGSETYDTLIQGHVTHFGYQADFKKFDFMVHVTGGTKYPINSTVGMIIVTGTPTPTTPVWTANFSSSGISGASDTFTIVPEPTSFILATCGAIGLWLGRRLSHRRRATPSYAT